MGLIQCPDCYNHYSDRAEVCPNCGGPNSFMNQGQPQCTSNHVVPYQSPSTPIQQPSAPPPASPQRMQPAQYQHSQAQPLHHAQHPPMYHDPTAVFVDPEEPFRNNSLIGAIKGQASFRATFLWWLVGFIGFSFLAFDESLRLAIVPAVVWFWGGIFLMFWNARNIYDGKLKRIVLWTLGILFALFIIASSRG